MSQVSAATKLLYGIGFSARGLKDGLFQLFLFFYFNNVLGLDAALAGTASLISLIFDAVSDPAVGLWSDKWKSKKWGRRHPFMMFSAVPLGLFTWLLFLPPEGMGQTGLFWWLLVFSVLVRLSITFFLIPHMSLGAEMSTDYEERTSITSIRIMFAAFVSPVTIILGLTTFFAKTEEYSNGLLNAAAYPKFAFLCGVLMIIFILITVFGTRNTIPRLPQASAYQERTTLTMVFKNLGQAFQMPSFRNLVIYIMIVYVAIGIGVTFTTYFTTYFFELTETELAFLPISSAVGGILAVFIARILGKKLDKKPTAIISTIIFAVFFSLPFNARLLDIFPANDSPMLVPVYVLSLTVAYTFLWVALSTGSSMMADVVDEFDLRTGQRQEGLFFSTMSFALKMTTGLGSFIAGLLLTLIAFPKQAEVGTVSEDAIYGLGLVGGPILMICYLVSLGFLVFYPITKGRYEQIRAQLGER
ncbi:MAG: MFS transporter [Bacteroidota bacterium]